MVDYRKDSQGEDFLCAYIVGQKELPILELKTALARELPDYMIPTYLIPVDKLPYTPKPAKLPETLEEMVTDYICAIKAIQPVGPYIIAGYCYGNWIGYKMVQMLESQDVSVERLIQINENAFLPDKARRYYKLKTVIFRPYRWMKKWFRRLITRRNMNPMDYWSRSAENNQKKSAVVSQIKNNRTVREQVNHLCTVGFSLKHLISTDTYVIKSAENNLQRYTKKDWEKQTSGRVWFVEIPGGHESIFAYPYLAGLVKAFQQALEE